MPKTWSGSNEQQTHKVRFMVEVEIVEEARVWGARATSPSAISSADQAVGGLLADALMGEGEDHGVRSWKVEIQDEPTGGTRVQQKTVPKKARRR